MELLVEEGSSPWSCLLSTFPKHPQYSQPISADVKEGLVQSERVFLTH